MYTALLPAPATETDLVSIYVGKPFQHDHQEEQEWLTKNLIFGSVHLTLTHAGLMIIGIADV